MWLRSPDGVRLHATWWAHTPADAPPDADTRGTLVVLVPGFTGHGRVPAVLRLVARLRLRADVLVPELRGHGRSGGRSTLGAREAADLDAAVTWARRSGYRRVVTLGFSFGAAVAVSHAALRGGVDAVAAVSVPSRWYVRDTRSMRALNYLVESVPGRMFARVVFRVRLAPGWRTVPASPIELAGRLAPVPLLVVHGEDDHYFPVEHAFALAAAAGPHAEVWIVPGFAHAENRLPPELADRVAGWLVPDVVPGGQGADGGSDTGGRADADVGGPPSGTIGPWTALPSPSRRGRPRP